MDKNTLYDILNSREERANKQKDLLSRYPYSLISFTLNIPGAVKDNPLYRKIHKEGIEAIKKALYEMKAAPVHEEAIYKKTGAECYISVDIGPLKLKKMTVEIEDKHELGRIFDIDVFDLNHNQISRADLNMGSRKCLLCEEDARMCVRSRRHPLGELTSKIEELANAYFNMNP